MENIERSVRTWMATGKEAQVDEVIASVAHKQTTLLQLVKSLGEYLTSEDDELRNKGVEFLSRVLERSPSDTLNRNSVKVLVTFYISKLEDTETVIPALKGLVTLTANSAFTGLDAAEVAKALFQHVKMKALIQSVRFNVFSILDNLISRHREALKGMGAEFIEGYIYLAEGEKDPRNLTVAFAIDRVIAIEFDITRHLEQFFNITFCYFPITFRPPPDDPYGITADDLRKSLRKCLEANPAFGPLAIPLFLEKLAAGSPITKRDTLQTIATCLPIYGMPLARKEAKNLWNHLRLEIFQPTDDQTAEEALATMRSLIQTFYQPPATGESDMDVDAPVTGLAKDICQECLKLLGEPEKSQAKPAMKTVCSLLKTTESVSYYTLVQVAPQLLKTFNDPDEISNRPQVLALLCQFLDTAKTISAGQQLSLVSYKDEILGAFIVGLGNSASQDPAITGLKILATTENLATDEELRYIVHNVNDTIEANLRTDEQISDAILDLLTSISKSSAKHVKEMTLPLLFASLPDVAPPRAADKERAKCWEILAALKSLCLEPELFETMIIRLLAKLDLVCATRPDADIEASAAYAHSLLYTLSTTLDAKVQRGDSDILKYVDKLIPQLFNLFIFASLTTDGYDVARDPRLIGTAGKITTSIVQTLPIERQQTLVDAVFTAYVSGPITLIASGIHKMPQDAGFHPFLSEASEAQRNTVALFASIVQALRKEVVIPSEPSAYSVLEWGMDQATNALQRDAAWHVLASIVNKQTERLESLLTRVRSEFWQHFIADKSVPVATRRRAIDAWVWITRALLIRNHSDAMVQVDVLFSLFDDQDLGWDAARAVGRVATAENVLTKRNHAISRILYAQKYCNALLPRVLQGAKTGEDSTLQNTYLVALTSLITALPKATYTTEMPTLMPLLLHGLELPDFEIRFNVITTLLAAAEGEKGKSGDKEGHIVSEHANTLVNVMLKNSMVSSMPSMRVRTAALRYLAMLPDLVRYDVLHPQKAFVLRELAKVLDDPKRAVRAEAVNARSRW
ncbi:ARM repeat-containing protein [Punctularia strigosozonata HHB-11173 SS5]|uniref:ARM repeat-containing protein n=1 Tax=Punctularia strigosozonata (strain HHB-11173) TaxID=741275 RepID=UPI00044178FA|nr:ARM repeat-containing protein [Punctularia strigosozonata HHB-11173 SS5]EIN09656.1 ARM repeat-containing protein [Punctularia strigosozonata HHB-11173 SS5]